MLKQWLSKALAGLILGAPLSFGVLGDLGLLLRVSAQLDQAEALLLRWVPGVVWVLVVCLSLTCRSGLRAVGAMLAGNIFVWGVYGLLYALCVAGWAAL
ncbi:hypothetical protein KB213_01770 [Neokomagataea sp. TBRC 2177]|uniref:Uncharacterized protein n=1 Tax=Neokomagataea anthophila TaxID=2826925 RepID=A0ABS5E4G0_9PROT|nr:hypothetical protein [Neokomagataea anthophila]